MKEKKDRDSEKGTQMWIGTDPKGKRGIAQIRRLLNDSRMDAG